MSTLTKIFVVLLVVVSMLNAAAVVVFVNKGQTSEEDLQKTQELLSQARKDVDAARNDASMEQATVTADNMQLENFANQVKTLQLKAAADAATAEDNLKKQQIENDQLNANVQSLTDQLAIALKSLQDANNMNNDLRNTNNQLDQKLADSDAAVAYQKQRGDQYGWQAEHLTEVNKSLQDQLTQFSNALTQHGIAVPQPGDVEPAAAPPISGTVQAKAPANGVMYLTISVGTADGVKPGMEFSVIGGDNSTPEFLGILKITSADVNSSFGRLDADDSMTAKIRVGDAVRTQLQ